MRDAAFKQVAWLIKNGVPFDVAHALMESGPEGQAEALGYAVAFAEMESGKTFNWERMDFDDG